jgi:hypothetical protein
MPLQTKPSYFLADETNLVDYQIIKIQKIELSPRPNEKKISINFDAQASSYTILNSPKPVEAKRYNMPIEDQFQKLQNLPTFGFQSPVSFMEEPKCSVSSSLCNSRTKKKVSWDLEKNKVYIY